MSNHEVLLGELQMYSDSLRHWGEKLKGEDVCSKITFSSENKDDVLKRYNMCKSLNVMEQEFQTQLMKHAGALPKLMNKLQDMVHCSLDPKEVIEKSEFPAEKTCDATPAAAAELCCTPVKKSETGSTFGGKWSPINTSCQPLPPVKKQKKQNKKL